MTSEGASVLVLLAHQDDELFIAPRLSLERSRGKKIRIVFLTDGGTERERRNQESLGYLETLGFSGTDLRFLGSELGVPDGDLVSRLQSVFDALLQENHPPRFGAIYCPAWEGGHQDHDAAHLLGVALGRRWGILPEVRQFYIYNGYRCRGRFFRIACPLPGAEQRSIRRWSWKEGWALVKGVFRFTSQKKTWLGLFPQSLIQFLWTRREVLDGVSLAKLSAPGHEGGLLYERYGRMTFQDFQARVRAFVDRELRA